MNNIFFHAQMDKLISAYTAKPFEGYRMTLIEQIVSPLSDFEFKKVVDHFISNSRQPPLPNDFKEAVRKELNARPRQEYDEPRPYQVLCRVCEDLGILRLVDDVHKVSVLGLCDCETGQRQVWKLPRASKVEGYRIQAVPHEPFIPEIPTIPRPKTHEEAKVLEINFDSLTKKKQEWWREKVRISEEFWQNDGNEPPEAS